MDNFSKQIYEAGINDGRAEDKTESIKNLMSTLNVSIDQAMDILKTPPEERQYVSVKSTVYEKNQDRIAVLV